MPGDDSYIQAERSRLDRFADLVVHFVPDAITASVIMLLALAAWAVFLGTSPPDLAEAYYKGFWSLLPFTGQMTLIVLLGTALTTTPFFRALVTRLSQAPGTAPGIIALGVLLSAACGYLFWGLGFALSPIIAVHFAHQAERKGIRLHFPFYMATIYASTAVWQFGLSSSAPLLVATPGHFLEKVIGVIPLSRTIWSPAALIHVGAFTGAVIAVGALLMPRRDKPVSAYPDAMRLVEHDHGGDEAPRTFSERLERKSFVTWLLCAAFILWLWTHFFTKSLGLNINALNMILLLLTFGLHSSVRNVSKALEKAVISAWPVIVLYHLYAGIAGLIEHTRVGENMAALVTSASSPATFPTLSAAIGTLFAFFIPSSGGQWAIQGLVTVKSAMALGVSVERALLSMQIGDHMGNLMSPFWYMVIAGIARIDFRTFFGYGLVYAVLWFVIGAIVFTVAPC